MSKIVIIGAGAMGSAFALPCLDNNHDINIVGTHLENDFIENLKNNNNIHPGLNTKIPEGIKIFKFDKFDELLKSKIDLIVLGISSKGIEWVSQQLGRIYLKNKIPNLLMLTKGLSVYQNKYELLVNKLERLLFEKGIIFSNSCFVKFEITVMRFTNNAGNQNQKIFTISCLNKFPFRAEPIS